MSRNEKKWEKKKRSRGERRGVGGAWDRIGWRYLGGVYQQTESKGMFMVFTIRRRMLYENGALYCSSLCVSVFFYPSVYLTLSVCLSSLLSVSACLSLLVYLSISACMSECVLV